MATAVELRLPFLREPTQGLPPRSLLRSLRSALPVLLAHLFRLHHLLLPRFVGEMVVVVEMVTEGEDLP